MPVSQPTDSDLKAQLSQLNQELGRLQRQAIQQKIPIVMLFEGADGAGKGALINRMLQQLDPRWFKVHSMHSPNEEEIYRPFLWRFWIRTPARGRMAIFDRSWYRLLLDDRVDGIVSDKQVPKIIREIINFEQQLTDDGVLVLKVYLGISEEKQFQRLSKLSNHAATSWRVTDKDWKRHKHYEQYKERTEEMIHRTHKKRAPWARIDSTHLKSANIELVKFVSEQLKKALKERQEVVPAKRNPSLKWGTKMGYPAPLEKVDLSLSMETEVYREKRKLLQQRLHDLEHELYVSRRPVVLVFEGWDAAGKGGAIRRLTKGLDPRGYEVIPVAAPNDLELSHHYLWRFWNRFPKGGHIAIYDRSWYGRVMVERLEGFCSEAEWKRAYEEINETEEHWANGGSIILKFWIHIDQDEQLRRFRAREQNPLKQWKITEEDWRNRKKWESYRVAVNDMIHLTNKPNAPWIIVEGNNKPYARIKVLETTVKALEQAL